MFLWFGWVLNIHTLLLSLICPSPPPPPTDILMSCWLLHFTPHPNSLSHFHKLLTPSLLPNFPYIQPTYFITPPPPHICAYFHWPSPSTQLHILADSFFAKCASPTDLRSYTGATLPLVRVSHPVVPKPATQ